jgi:hypothetical protein
LTGIVCHPLFSSLPLTSTVVSLFSVSVRLSVNPYSFFIRRLLSLSCSFSLSSVSRLSLSLSLSSAVAAELQSDLFLPSSKGQIISNQFPINPSFLSFFLPSCLPGLKPNRVSNKGM